MFPDVIEVNFTLTVDPLRRRPLGSPDILSSFQVIFSTNKALLFFRLVNLYYGRRDRAKTYNRKP
jgi:hypothetical protein